jgi:hypothetical protein
MPAPARRFQSGHRPSDHASRTAASDGATSWIGGRETLEGRVPPEVVQRKQHLTAEEHGAEEDQEEGGEDGQDAQRDRVVPPAQRPGEKRPQQPHPEAGQQVHRSPVGHRGAV